MAVIEYDEYKQKLQALEPTLQELEKALSIPKAREELAQLQKETEQEGFWSDVDRSQKVSQQIKRLESKVKKYVRLGRHPDPVRNGTGGGRRLPAAGGDLRL